MEILQLSTCVRERERGKQISGHDWGDLSQFLFFSHDGFCMRTIEPSLAKFLVFLPPSGLPRGRGTKVPNPVLPTTGSF